MIVLLDLVEKHSPLSFFDEMLFFRVIVFILHDILSSFFFRNKVQTNQKNTGVGMFFCLIEAHDKNSVTFEGKSHVSLAPSHSIIVSKISYTCNRPYIHIASIGLELACSVG